MKCEDADSMLFFDNKARVSFDHIRLVGFALNGRLFGVAKEVFTWRIIIDGKSRKLYDALVELNDDSGEGGHTGFTPDGDFTYLAARDRSWYLVTEKR